MNAHISSVKINAYRGINGLIADNLGSVNIILGDNNCGKTSFLEAVRILCLSKSINHIAYISERRGAVSENFVRYSRLNALLASLVKNQEEYRLNIEAEIRGNKTFIDLSGSIERRILNVSEMDSLTAAMRKRAVPERTGCLTGKIRTYFDAPPAAFVFHKYSRIIKPREAVLPVTYLSPASHTAGAENGAINEENHLADTLNLLRSFDPNIIDLKMPEDDNFHRRTWLIEDKNFGYLPLSAFGGGIKRIVTFAAAVSSARQGVLLIDEFETSLYTKGMKSVFAFLIQACEAKGIQLFVTTQSEEALDKMLECGEEASVETRVVTLSKKEKQTFAQTLDGRKARELRVYNEAELR